VDTKSNSEVIPQASQTPPSRLHSKSTSNWSEKNENTASLSLCIDAAAGPLSISVSGREELGPPTVAVTDAVALTEPEVAVIVAVPFPAEVTRPATDTLATATSDVAHVTVALAIVAPFWSLTVAAIWDVAPRESKLRLVTERVIEVATGVGVGVVAV